MSTVTPSSRTAPSLKSPGRRLSTGTFGLCEGILRGGRRPAYLSDSSSGKSRFLRYWGVSRYSRTAKDEDVVYSEDGAGSGYLAQLDRLLPEGVVFLKDGVREGDRKFLTG